MMPRYDDADALYERAMRECAVPSTASPDMVIWQALRASREKSVAHAARVAELEREVERLRGLSAFMQGQRKDARRYRWLRSLDGSCDAAACVNINIGFDWIEQNGDALDTAIDAAMAREGAALAGAEGGGNETR